MARLKFRDTIHRFFRMIQLYKGFGQPKLIYPLFVIFAEFFAWGLLTTPTIAALKDTFPGQTLMINGLIWGIKTMKLRAICSPLTSLYVWEYRKRENHCWRFQRPHSSSEPGTLSFLMSPPIGYFSDVFGRKPFLLITVLFTCLPIPVLFVSSWWFFIMTAISGLFSVTFSVVFAYVADLTTGPNRSSAYGKVSATFAASMILSPALGAHLGNIYESLPEKLRSPQLSLWDQATPISTIRKIGQDFMIWTLCLTVFLSYLPEAGQYSCFFVYLKLFIGFDVEQVATFIAFIGLLSVLAQTILLTYLIDRYGGKNTILAGLLLQAAQLLLLGFCKSYWMMWISGIIASLSSITYPAISAYISTYADADKQGLVQGLITGVRSLCGGIGPAMFGLLFFMFGVDLDQTKTSSPYESIIAQNVPKSSQKDLKPTFPSAAFDTSAEANHSHLPKGLLSSWIVGPPFLFGAILVLLAAVAATFIPDTIMPFRRNASKTTIPTSYYRYTTVSSTGGNSDHEILVNNGNGLNLSNCELSNEEIED